MLEPWIETHSGIKMYFLEPKEDMVNIKDIAHSLSLQCRFSGHTNRFYSVAEHCTRIASLLLERTKNPKIALQGLLHDATEAYLLDVPSPVKQYLGGYYEIENKLMSVILNKFGAGFPLNALVKEADTVMLKNEARALLPSKGVSWVDKYPTKYEFRGTPFCNNSKDAEFIYLSWFDLFQKEMYDQRSTVAA